MVYDELEARARAAMDPVLHDYVAGGAGDEHTQQANVAPSDRWGIVPRMLAGTAERDLSIELFGRRYPTPLFMAPIGVIGVMHESQHGDLEVARAAAATGVPGGDLDPDAGPDGGRRGRARRHARLLPALHAERPRAG